METDPDRADDAQRPSSLPPAASDDEPSADVYAAMSDEDLLTAYRRTSQASGDHDADALAAEIARRGWSPD